MLCSPKAYKVMRDSEFIYLPSKRTLRDYTNWIKCTPGFQPEVTELLRKETKDLPELKRY